jgi:hypothetical protein
MSVPKGAAIALIVAGVLGIVLTVSSTGSVKSYVKDHYKRAGSDQGAEIYTSTKPPATVAAEIAKAHKPADRRVTPEGVFLRYRKDFVGVLARGTGSRIEVADERRGYALFFPFVGGYWGSYSGPAETFRGGGPGGGGK